MSRSSPRALVFYHYFHPDDVVSARHYDDLCLELSRRGWQVEVRPSNRGYGDEHQIYAPEETWNQIAIRRVWRPAFPQSSTLGRLANSAWMVAAWSLVAVCRRDSPDVVIVGSDPVLSVVSALVIRTLRPRIRIAHWCFDLYPEAAIADGLLEASSLFVRGLRRLLRAAYARCDLIADLGWCMRQRLAEYHPPGQMTTLVAWALFEPDQVLPPDPKTRHDLFGECRLGLLYSGNFGRAHSFQEFLALARELRGSGIQFCFGVRGNKVEELQAAVRSGDENIRLAGFAPESELALRLTAADIHLVSLRPEWTGLVVPSKFFGCLAAGRPVLFAGSRDSCLARLIQEHGVGWILDESSLATVAGELKRLSQEPDRLRQLQHHCRQVYHRHFSKRLTTERWDRELRALLV